MKIDFVQLLILGLATWRVASLFVNEEGPFKVFERVRRMAGIEEMRLDDKPEVYKAVPETFAAQVLSCVWCASVWVGLWISILYFFFPMATVWVCLPLALSAMAVGVEVLVKRELPVG